MGLVCRRREGFPTGDGIEGETGGLGKQLRSTIEDVECVQKFLNHPQAIDTVYFMGFTKTDKTFFVTRLCRRLNSLCEIWLFLRVEGIGCFEHPIHPDSTVSAESEKCWSGGGLRIDCLEAYRRWRISFNGFLRKGPYRSKWNEEEGDLLHVKLTFIWTSFSPVFNFDIDSHPSALAHAFAKEKWNKRLLDSLKVHHQQHTHYEQWGQYVGEVEIEGHERKELLLTGLRDHSYGIRVWADMYRYALFIVHFENGLSVNFTLVCIPATTTHLTVGYVLFPNGKKAGIDWSDISLADIADDEVIADMYRISFTADGKYFDLRVSIDKSACPVVYNGLTWEGRIHECMANYHLNLTIRGRGLVEFHFRNESGRQAPDFTAATRFREPVVVPAHCGFALAFSHPSCQSATVVGGKGAQLAQLTEMQKRFGNQFRVPEGLCVTITALEHQMKMNSSLQEAVEELDAVICTRKQGELQDLCRRCVELFKVTKLAPEIETAIHSCMSELQLLGAEEWFVVRSSATGEDTEDMSAAGQLSTELGLKGFGQISEGVQKCWASLYSFQAVQYRSQRGQPVPSTMGVVIQRMVPAEAAGVLFTCDPVNGHPGRMVINANYGLGESVVSGMTEPDSITLSRSVKGQCQIIRKDIGAKTHQLLQTDDWGILHEEISSSQDEPCCITDDVILRLSQIALRVEKAYGSSRDIEWAIKDANIYLLQARPITTLDIPSEFELMHEFDSALTSDFEWLTTCNIGEMMPGAVTPLTCSLLVRAIEYGIQDLTIKSGGKTCFAPYNSKAIAVCCTHLFINLTDLGSMYEQNNLITKKKISELALLGRELQELTIHDLALIHGASSLWKRILNSFTLLKYLFNAESRVKAILKNLETFQIPLANGAKEFYFNIDQLLPLFYEGWAASMALGSRSGIWSTIVTSILSNGKSMWTPKLLADVAKLYSTCPDILSADMPTLLEAVTEAIKKQGKTAEFVNMNAQTAVSWLLSQESGEAGQKFQNFLQKHGYRCLREAELREKSWASEPAKVIPAIQAALQSSKARSKKLALSPEEAIASIKSPITWLGKLILSWVLPKARKAVASRELSKSAAVQTNDKFKIAFCHLAQLMVQEGLLPDVDLLFFLSHLEIRKVLLYRSPALILRAQSRRRLLVKQMALQFEEINIGKPIPRNNSAIHVIGEGFTLRGMTISQGIVEGTAHVVKTTMETRCIQQGDILIITSTDVGWSPYFPLLGGLVTELGGLLSHGAVVAREYGLPCIVNCRNATNFFKSGDTVILNGSEGFVQKVVKKLQT
uniref:Uncharacterized LOC103175934 n=1 Tax=Callorhinchus milii TaxID=7868 RepID=A0A4W3IUY6_CALMI